MTMMVWQYPMAFQALWGVGILLLLWIFNEIWRQSTLQKLGDAHLRNTTLVKSSSWRRVVREIMGLLAIISVVFALANPQGGKEEMEVERQGLDIVFALDLSRSMLATDIAPSRLEMAKQLVRNIVESSTGDRVGILSFSGNSFVQMPITSDMAAADLTLRHLDPKYIPTSGSDISSVFEIGLKMFGERGPQDRVMVVLSDGEDHEGNWESMVENAVDSGVFVYTIGIGTTAGSPIPGVRGNEYHKDADGEVVISKREEGTLMDIAHIGGGKYYDGNQMNVTEQFIEDIKELQRIQFGMTKMSDMEDLFQIPLGLALLFLSVRLLLSERSTNQLNKWLKNA